MADEPTEMEFATLKRRVTLLESEVRVFTPPISRLERQLWEFRAEVSQRMDTVEQRINEFRGEVGKRIDGVERRIDAVEQRVAATNQKIDRLHLEFGAKTDQIIVLLRELVAK